MWDRAVMTLRGLRLLLGAAVFGVMLVLAAPAAADTLTVTNTNDSGTGSLRDAIANSSSSTTINFDPSLAGQEITLTTGVLSITHALTISGLGAGSLTISGNHASRVFDIAAPNTDDVTISGLTITGGSFSGTTTPRGGGGILLDTGRTLTLDGDTITGNQVSVSSAGFAGGGGVYADGEDMTVSNTSITNNTVNIVSATDENNGGGGIYTDGGDVTLTGSDVSDNTVQQNATISSGDDGGGGIYTNGGDLDLTSVTMRGNSDNVDSSTSGDDGGGGIYSDGGDISLGATTIDGNSFGLGGSTAGDNGGGGVYLNGGDVAIVLSSIDANSLVVGDSSTDGGDGGGAIYSFGGTVGTDFSSLSQNTATVSVNGNGNGGGAVFDDSSDSIYLTSTISDNKLTLSGNGTQNNGGGAVHSFDGGLISAVTMAGNSINAPGGGLFLAGSSGTFDLKDTIIADNTAGSAGNCSGAGTFASAGFNLESGNTCGLNATGDLVNTEPKLGPLQNNGGPTPTRALLAGSPATDAGSCSDVLGNPLTIDQREVARPQPAGGKCDIGAFELQPSVAPPPAPPATTPGTPAATSSTGASFSGSVNPQGQATTVSFQYGLDSRYRPGGGTAIVYDQSTPPQTLPADSTPHAVSAAASNLVPNAVYHVRLVATNATGTTFGPDQTFTTMTDPAPPPPVLGQKVDVRPVSGQVFVLVGTKLVPLTEASQLRSGTVVDTRHGQLELTAATTAKHKRQTGVFGGAVFKITQTRAALTTLSLVESAFQGAPSFATCRAHKLPDARAAAASKRTLQLLHASAHGKFSTRGRYSAATVLGTKWTIADRCDGTLVHDIKDSVVVSDLVRHKKIVLHAGQSYLAKPRHK